jgi:4-amino-4-deoxy-L-arabinose transferase-like glycosyltransferase
MTRLRETIRDHAALIGLQALVVIGGVWLRWPSMSYALTEAHTFRQTQTTLMIREYMTGGLFQLSPLPVFGPPWQVPMEFPLFQWVAALGGNVIGTSPQIAGRLTALIFFEVSALLVAYLAYRWFSPAASVAAMVLFQFLPFGYQWGNAPLIEFLATAGALAALVCVERWRQRPGVLWVVLATLAFLVTFLVKPTTAVVWVPVYLALSIDWRSRGIVRANLARWPLAVPLVVGVVGAAAWTRIADSVKADNRYSAFLTSGNLSDWNYGTIDQRLDAQKWQMILGYSEAIVGSLAVLAVLLLAALYVWPRRAVLVGLALSLPAGALVFFNLYYMHTYYQSAIFPAFVLVMGAGIGALVRLARGVPAKWSVAGVALATVLALAWVSPEGQGISHRTVNGLYEFPLAAEIAANVPEGSGVIIAGCDWDPTYFYLSGRRGLMIRTQELGTPVPSEWLGPDLQYVALCDPTVDVSGLFPVNTPFDKVSDNIYRLAP